MGARSAAASVVRHAGGVAAEAFLVAALVATVALAFSPVYAPAKFLAGTETTLAAKGGNGGNGAAKSSSVTVSVPSGVFAGTTTAVTSAGLWVYGTCSQNATVVYTQYVKTDSSGNAVLTLGPTPMWTGGSASCTATAGLFTSTGAWRAQASTTFSVSG